MERRTEIIVETHETIVVRPRTREKLAICARCGAVMDEREKQATVPSPSALIGDGRQTNEKRPCQTDEQNPLAATQWNLND